MRVESEITRWGNSLAICITDAMAEIPHFTEGSKISINVTERGLEINPIQTQKSPFRLLFSEAELLAGLTPETAHADELPATLRKELGE